MPSIAGLFVYPVKSCRALTLPRAVIGAAGPVLGQNNTVVESGLGHEMQVGHALDVERNF